MKKSLVVGIWIVVLAVLVWAASPTTPTLQSPANNTVYMNGSISVTCDSSTDVETYEIYQNITNYTWSAVGSIDGLGDIDSVVTTNSLGYRFLIVEPTGVYLRGVTRSASTSGGRARLFTDDYTLIDSQDTASGDNFWFQTNPYLEHGKYYRVELDNEEASYTSRQQTNAGWPAGGGSISIKSGSVNGTGTNDPKWYNMVSLHWRQKIDSTEVYMVSNSSDETVTIYNWPTSIISNNLTCVAGNEDGYSEYTEPTNVYGLNFTDCGGEGCGNNQTALQVVFLDEKNGSAVSASLNSFSAEFNSTDQYGFAKVERIELHQKYAFGLLPNDFYINTWGNLSFQSGIDYPNRKSNFAEEIIGNDTTNVTFYLLHLDDGEESIIQVQDSSTAALVGVKVTAYLNALPLDYDASVWTQVESGYTGGAGEIKFWLNPDSRYKLVLEKSGYTTTTTYIDPLPQITVQMGVATEDVAYIAPTRSMEWEYGPGAGPVGLGSTYDFNFNISASLGNLIYCAMNITNSTNDVVASAEGCDTDATYYGENLSDSYTIQDNDTLIGKYYITIDSECKSDATGSFLRCDKGALQGTTCSTDADCEVYGLLGTTYWTEFPFNFSTTTSIKSAFSSMADWDSFGEDVEGDASRIIFFFIFGTIIIGAINYFTGIGMTNPGQEIGIIAIVVIIASIAGFFEINFLAGIDVAWAAWFEKYTVALIVFLFAGGFILNDLRRRHEL